MKLIHVALIILLLLVMVTPIQCQQTAEDWIDKGNALAGQRDYDKAIEAYEEAIKSDPNSTDAWNRMGEALTTTGKHDEANKAYKKATQLSEQEKLAELAKKLAPYDDAINKNPTNLTNWFKKAHALLGDGFKQNATEVYDEANMLNRLWRTCSG